MKVRRRNNLPSVKTLLLIGGALCFALLLVRGCLSYQKGGDAHGGGTPLAGETLFVYDAKLDKTVEMGLEEYLVHVVAGEMPASFSQEALKAQAVAARTYTVRRIASLGGTPCGRGGADLCTDSTCCQAYKSDEQLKKNWGGAYAQNLARIRAAVEATAGEIITYGGSPIEALFHSNAGGKTEDAQHVFVTAQPYLVSVDSPDQNTARASDTVRLTRAEAAKAINKLYPDADVTAKRLDRQLKVLSRFESGRVNEIAVGDATLTGRQFRHALGLESANFSLSFSDKYLSVSTMGYGHGVGMSQYGADAMADAGSSYREILTHYYTGVKIEPLGSVVSRP